MSTIPVFWLLAVAAALVGAAVLRAGRRRRAPTAVWVGLRDSRPCPWGGGWRACC